MRSGRTTVDHVGWWSVVTDRALHLDTYQVREPISTFLTSTGDEADERAVAPLVLPEAENWNDLYPRLSYKPAMPLFNESIESIAQAIVTIKRASEHGVLEEEKYKGLHEYLNKRAADFKVKKSHITKANLLLDDELQSEVEEFFMEEGDALYKWAEELLEEHEKDLVKESETAKAWAKMTNKERAEMAALASAWQNSA